MARPWDESEGVVTWTGLRNAEGRWRAEAVYQAIAARGPVTADDVRLAIRHPRPTMREVKRAIAMLMRERRLARIYHGQNEAEYVAAAARRCG